MCFVLVFLSFFETVKSSEALNHNISLSNLGGTLVAILVKINV